MRHYNVKRGLGIKRQPWMDRALCRMWPVELWFSPDDRDVARAKAVCAMCGVRKECLAYAVGNGETFGVWGGADPVELRRLRRERKNGAA